MDVKFCRQCGAALTPGAKFCVKCGTATPIPVVKPEPSGRTPTPPAPVPTPAPAEAGKKRRKTGKAVMIIFLSLVLICAAGIAVLYFAAPKTAHKLMPFLPCAHEWEKATCTEPKTCRICGATEGKALGHEWEAATCEKPKTCEECGATKGAALGHQWKAATCTEPETCTVCGATRGDVKHDVAFGSCTAPRYCRICGIAIGDAPGHTWKAATCTEPKTCTVCGATEGSTAAHTWKAATCQTPKTCTVCCATEGSTAAHTWSAATYTAPKTCTVCGATEGEPLAQPMYLIDMNWKEKYGKLYYHTPKAVTFSYNADWNDIETNGYLDYCKDNKGNYYENGIHLDGPDCARYYVTYSLNGKYTKLTGVVAVDYGRKDESRSYEKCIYIYGDGKLLYTSPKLNTGSSPRDVSVDITGVKELKIMYSDTTGQNDICVFYNARVS